MGHRSMPDAPRQVGRYEIKATLGAGAMGVVYKAHDPIIERPVAIKLVRANLLDSEERENFLARFRNEAKLAGRCAHPRIVGIYDYATHEGNPYLVMEYVEGADLGRVFKRGQRASVNVACTLALRILDALAYAHGFGIVHRDIKPANILLTTSDALKVTDFGIARLAIPDSKQSAMLVGTPSYMAPEQCRGEPLDGRCDLFALGCVLFELLAGERAFASESYVETIYKILRQPHPALGSLRPDLPAPLIDIVDRALAKRVDERYASAAEMATALRGVSAVGASRGDEQETVALSALKIPEARGVLAIEDASLSTIERRLASYIGPMASYHLRRALQNALSVEELCEMLGQMLPEEGQRTAFMREVQVLLSCSGSLEASRDHALPGSAACDAASLARMTRALTEVMGPIAPKLIAKAQSRATSIEQMEELCTALIPRPEEREQFHRLLARRSAN